MASGFDEDRLVMSEERVVEEVSIRTDQPSIVWKVSIHTESPRNPRWEVNRIPAKEQAERSPHCSRRKTPPEAQVEGMVKRHKKDVRTRRLMTEYQEICKSYAGKENPPFTVELVNDNLYEWNIKLYQVDQDSDFYQDMQKYGVSYVLLNLTFPSNFPFEPPFMRVVSPHIKDGFVMEGGAICMELLTPSGWACAYTIEAVVMQFATNLVKGGGRILSKSSKMFNKVMARDSFRSLVKVHVRCGWKTPPLCEG